MPNGGRSLNRLAFTSVLATAMAAATFAGPALGVLARFIIDDLGITRGELGFVVAAYSAAGALASPLVGRVTDQVGGRKAAMGIFLISGLGMMAISAAPGYWLLIGAAMVTGVGQSAGNPATNKLISVHISEGRRGSVTGIKQSGVQVGVFFAGVALPSSALAIGWRPTMLIAGVAVLTAIVAVRLVVPVDPPQAIQEAAKRRLNWSAPVMWLMGYGFLMGMAAGSLSTYIPLYGEEGLGLSVPVAGLVAGLAGLVAVFTRILWARSSEKRGTYVRTLTWIAALSVLFSAALLAAPTVGVWALWVGALGMGATAVSWNSVGMLAVMVEAGDERAGGASGVVLMGFLGGLGVGPPLFGWSVDRYDSYGPGLTGLLIVVSIATIVGFAWERSRGTIRGS